MKNLNLKDIVETLTEQFVQLEEKSNMVLLIIDQQGKFEYANETIEHILTYTPDQLIGRNIIEFTELGTSPILKEILTNGTKEARPVKTLGIFCAKCLKHYFDGIITPYNKNGQDYYVFYLHDITQRKRNEDRLIELNDELNSFTYKVSHDLKSPLKSIQGLIQLIRMDNSDAKEYVDLLHTSADRLQDYITQLAQYARSDNQSETAVISFGKLIQEIFSNYKFISNVDKIKLKVSIDQEVVIHSDPMLMQIILNNLISNAITYHNYNQKSPTIQISVTSSKEEFKITVKDNGIGIDKKHIPSIFDMFQTGTEQPNGSGLGLHMVKKAVEKVNGEVNVHSELGIGTEFIIRIPNLCCNQINSRLTLANVS